MDGYKLPPDEDVTFEEAAILLDKDFLPFSAFSDISIAVG